ncbi:hypothetical protein BUALT_Bualt06G0134100 [Buddleja alternifolia]|uniref:Major facilitator superfamily (MFS) profile domain-containing protein n=1 Tax=Buddleja alternifolia TaxID=168488 RepID=A0AAV6XGI2_9LAMI|nr:hypothetical protein BUALT_Bualt06G0134100 [Buddleja alternifolia]
MTLKGESIEYNGKITWFVFLSSIIAASGGLIFGYGAAVTAGLIASFVASPVTTTLGRRASIIIGGAAFLAGSALGGAAQNIYMLIFGRLLLGAGVGFTNQSAPLYLSEVAPPKYRGAFNFGFQLCVGVGCLIAFFVTYITQKIKGDWGWRISLATATVPALIQTISAMFLPETPNSLIQHGHDQEKAKTLLQKIRGTENVEAEFDDLIKASEASRTIKHPFKKILERQYRPQLVMSIAIPFFQQVTGINLIVFFAPILFMTIGSGVSTSLVFTVVIGIVGSITTILSSLIVDKVGRKVIFYIGGIQMFIPLMMIGGIMAAKLGEHGGLSKGYSILILVLICIYVSGFGLSWGPLSWLVPSEIFPLEIRSAGQSITVAVGFLSTIIVAQSLLAMLCHFKYAIFFIFGVWVVLMTAFVYILLPETKDVPIEKMEKIWKEDRFWNRYVGDAQI